MCKIISWEFVAYAVSKQTFGTFGGHKHATLFNVRINIVRVVGCIRNFVVRNKIYFIFVQKFVTQFPRSIRYNLQTWNIDALDFESIRLNNINEPIYLINVATVANGLVTFFLRHHRTAFAAVCQGIAAYANN